MGCRLRKRVEDSTAARSGGGQGGHDNNVEGLGEWETDHEGMAAFSHSVSESAGGMELLDEVPPPDSDSDEDEDDHVEQVDLPHCPYSLVSFSCKPGTGPSYVNTLVPSMIN